MKVTAERVNTRLMLRKTKVALGSWRLARYCQPGLGNVGAGLAPLVGPWCFPVKYQWF